MNISIKQSTFSEDHHQVNSNAKKILAYIIFTAALLILSVLVQNDLSANDNSQHKVYVTQNTLQKIVWREDIYDPNLKGTVNVIKLDDNYFANISGPEKAVLGYLASTIGNECYADGSKQNVKCKILSALNMGYQCSEESKTFLKNWFRDDAVIVSQVEKCKPTLPTTIEKTFDEVKISSADNKISVELKGLKLNIKENSVSRWSESMTFRVEGDKVSLTERTKKSD
ncbi:MAG TPA: hypothetical protein PKE39_16245 [Ignavibacteria bacterium]|nr:hypothetical protein [Ignavibacteria bacterium]HMR00575.1 hypothetical protein [Ignavibacteria bacterium]